MASYESDSSVDEDQAFTETDVLLGFACKVPEGETLSHLGGRPDWIDNTRIPSAGLARCKSCNDLEVLLLQLNAELPDRFPGHERRLYVFACKRKSCRRAAGSIRALRGSIVAENAPKVETSRGEKEKKPSKAMSTAAVASRGLGEALFGVKPLGDDLVNPFSSPAAANPFSLPSLAVPENPFNLTTPKPKQAPDAAATMDQTAQKKDTATAELPRTFAEMLVLNDPQQPTVHEPPPPPEPWPEESAQPLPYPASWLSEAEYETLEPTPAPASTRQYSNMDVDAGEGGGGAGREDKEIFESSMDATFQHFADRVGQNPEQCIRYEFGGQPLLYSKSDAVGTLLHAGGDGGKVIAASKGMPRCPNCGANRVFEVQLMPHAIEELEGDDLNLDGMDWGTIIVGVCERDCQERGTSPGEASYLEEWVGVQWEELGAKR